MFLMFAVVPFICSMAIITLLFQDFVQEVFPNIPFLLSVAIITALFQEVFSNVHFVRSMATIADLFQDYSGGIPECSMGRVCRMSVILVPSQEDFLNSSVAWAVWKKLFQDCPGNIS